MKSFPLAEHWLVCELSKGWFCVNLIMIKEETLTGMQLFILQNGMTKSVFVNDITMAAQRSAQSIN